MAIYHLSVKYISRRKAQSAVAAAAYRSGEKLHDAYYGLEHDYTRKKGIAHTEIMLPPNAPNNLCDREVLWNSVEQAERRCDSRLAREVEIALPNELTLEENIKLVREYVSDNFVSQGMVADVAIHVKHPHNPHAHILLTTRPVDGSDFSKKKNREWDKRANITIWRERWALEQNREFRRKGLEITVDDRSYLKQGVDLEPTKHLGHAITELERRGIRTDRGNKNRDIKKAREKEKNRDRLISCDRDRD